VLGEEFETKKGMRQRHRLLGCFCKGDIYHTSKTKWCKPYLRRTVCWTAETPKRWDHRGQI